MLADRGGIAGRFRFSPVQATNSRYKPKPCRRGAPMMCPKCRQTLNDGARFCSSCGESIPEQTPPRATDAPFTPAWSTAGGPSASSPSAAAVPMHGLLNRVKGILLSPRTEWNVIAPEDTGVPQLFKGYVLPLVGLAMIVQLLHMSVVGISLP